MRSRVALASLFLATLIVALPFAAHAAASIPFFGPILEDSWVDSSNSDCALGWGAVILVINNIIRLFITLVIVFVAPLMIAWAGFLYVVTPVSPNGKSEARKMLQNLVVGLVVALAAWLIVDAVMAVFYNKQFGNWYEIITTGGQGPCLSGVSTTLNQGNNTLPGAGNNGGTNTGGSTGEVTAGSGATSSSPPGHTSLKTACTTASLTSTFGSAAAAMSCATLYENAPCNPSEPSGTDRTLDNKPISIGLFQVNLSANNLNYPSCQQAVGSSGPLNCTQVFTGRLKDAQLSRISIVSGKEGQYATCVKAASNIQCNLDAAKTAYNDRVSRNENPLSAWGNNARNNCSSLLPTPPTRLATTAPWFWQQLVAMLSLDKVL